jgi:hypothetical protein
MLRSVGRVVVPALVVWLSGLACLLTCAAVCYGARTPACGTGVEESHTTAKAHACCAVKGASHETAETTSDAMAVREDHSEAGTCCFSTARPTMTAPLPLPVTVAAALPAIQFTPPVPDRDAAPRAVAAVPPLSRGDTYLRCCVLLI